MGAVREPRQFIEDLRRGALAVPVQVAGMIRAAEENSDSIQVTRDCSSWVSIPASMIEEINLLGTMKCKDHNHHVASIRFKEPQSEEGAVYARLITEHLVTPPTPRKGDRHVSNDGYVPGGCAACLRDCYRHCGGYDPECVRDYLMSYCPECAG
jgi:hypothetical protein